MRNLVLPVMQVCERLHATLSKKSCGARFRKVHPENTFGKQHRVHNDSYCVACINCPIGAANAEG